MLSDTARRLANRSPLSPQELARFRDILAKQLEKCRDVAEGSLPNPGEDRAISDDPADLASESFELDLSINLLSRAQTERDEIDQALERIDQRSYGLCNECTQPIPIARLEAIPTATSCIPCKSKAEQE
jgi:DnaK suppressor protein